VSMLRALHQFLQYQARLPRNTEELEKLPISRGAPEQEKLVIRYDVRVVVLSTLTHLIVSWIL
jgi:hypothetical protein